MVTRAITASPAADSKQGLFISLDGFAGPDIYRYRSELMSPNLASLHSSVVLMTPAPYLTDLIKLIDDYCTFPAIEKVKLFRLVLFNFLIGNEDMHLKNYSVIVRDNKVELSPAYDLLNTTIIQIWQKNSGE